MSLSRFLEMTECAVDKLSITKTAAIGFGGSATSLIASKVPDLEVTNAYLHTATLGVGLAVGVATFIVIALKGAVIWRHRHKPPSL